jgi:hypothetical protein
VCDGGSDSGGGAGGEGGEGVEGRWWCDGGSDGGGGAGAGTIVSPVGGLLSIVAAMSYVELELGVLRGDSSSTVIEELDRRR